jgi:hypothetical protein
MAYVSTGNKTGALQQYEALRSLDAKAAKTLYQIIYK